MHVPTLVDQKLQPSIRDEQLNQGVNENVPGNAVDHTKGTKKTVAVLESKQPVSPPKVVRQGAASVKLARAGKGLFAVQVASSQDYKNLAKIFENLKNQHPMLTKNLKPNFQIAQVKDARYYRLKLGEYANKSAALEKCKELEAVGIDCIVASYTPSDFSLILNN